MGRSSRVLAALAVGTVIGSAAAEARPSTTSYTCSGVRDLIARRGGITMNVKGTRVYRRFVPSRARCAPGQVTETYFAPTKSGQCRLRICVDPTFDDERFRFRFR